MKGATSVIGSFLLGLGWGWEVEREREGKLRFVWLYVLDDDDEEEEPPPGCAFLIDPLDLACEGALTADDERLGVQW